jgi:hypothetical protein
MLRDDGSEGVGGVAPETCSVSRLISARSNPWQDFIGTAAATPGRRTLAVTRSVPLRQEQRSGVSNRAMRLAHP